VLIATEPFTGPLEELARLCGAPQLRWATVAHPIGSLDTDELTGRAKAAAAQIEEVVLEDRQ
jgi:hypothetical protein